MPVPIKNTRFIFITGLGLMLLALYFFLFSSYGKFFPKCPLYILTHFYCPGCGSQRALAALLHGHITEALHNNALMVLSLPLLGYAGYKKYKKEPVAFLYSRWFPWLLLLLVLLFWVLRNIPGYPFQLLAPLAG